MIVLDTHAWIWWVSSPEGLSPTARAAIDAATEESVVFVSSISCWEVSLLVEKGRLELAMSVEDWLAGSEALPFVTFVPVDNRIAVRSNRLSGAFHDDPADRIIVATTLGLGAKLVTRDRKIQRYPHVESVW